MRITKENTTALFIDFQERLFPAMDQKEILLKNTKILLEGLSILGIPIAFTQQYTKGLGETIGELSALVPGFEAIEKSDFSCFGLNLRKKGMSVRDCIQPGKDFNCSSQSL